jgi:outer membrane biosynthesis protein TonB
LSPSQNEARDPVFLQELKELVKQGKVPVKPPEKVIFKKRIQIFDRQAILYSVGFHVLIILVMIVRAIFPNLFMSDAEVQARLKMAEMHEAIRVDIVGLPSLTKAELQKIDLTEEAPKTAGPTNAQPPKEEVIVVEPSKTAMTLPDPNITKKEQAEIKELDRVTRLKAARDALKKELSAESRRKALMDKLNDRGGRKAVEGNIVSKGSNASGSVADQMDEYQGKLKGHIRRYWNVPSWMNASSLKAQVLVKFSVDGGIVHKEFLAKSGNEEFDRSVEKTINEAEPFPPPPDLLKKVMLEEGIVWVFPQ